MTEQDYQNYNRVIREQYGNALRQRMFAYPILESNGALFHMDLITICLN